MKGTDRPATVGAKTRADLEARKRENTPQLLFKCARLVNELAIARIDSAAGVPTLKASYTALFPHLDFEGVRVVELARKVGVTKQAVSQTLAELVEHGVVELVPDPEDRRAKRARFTKKGADAIAHGLSVLAGIERELAAKIGPAEMGVLNEVLLRIEQILERRELGSMPKRSDR